VIGVLVWLATALTFRFAAGVDRRTAGWYRRRPIRSNYQRPHDDALLSRVRVVTTDPRTWKDVGWLAVNSTVGSLIATAALTVTGLNLGIYTVTSTGWALVTTGLGLVLLPVAALLNRAAAGHAGLAARLLANN
jgi:predicted phage tail protein